MKNTYYIAKGSKFIDSPYLNELPVKHVYPRQSECDLVGRYKGNKKIDKFGMYQKFVPSRMFPIRQNSWICFSSKEKAEEFIVYMVDEITKDERFSIEMKKEIIKYINTFKIVKK